MNMRADLFAVTVLLLIVPSKTKNIQWTLAKSTGVRYTNHLAETTAVSGVACAYVCMWTGRCFVANYNSVTMACNMIEDDSTSVNDADWDSYIAVSGIVQLHCYVRHQHLRAHAYADKCHGT